MTDNIERSKHTKEKEIARFPPNYPTRTCKQLIKRSHDIHSAEKSPPQNKAQNGRSSRFPARPTLESRRISRPLIKTRQNFPGNCTIRPYTNRHTLRGAHGVNSRDYPRKRKSRYLPEMGKDLFRQAAIIMWPIARINLLIGSTRACRAIL